MSALDLRVGDAQELIKTIPDGAVDLILTSPPYDQLRHYSGGPAIDLFAFGKEVERVLKPGGVAVVVLQDQTIDGAKTLTTFKLATAWHDHGLRLFECLIYERQGVPGAWWSRRFRVDHEYMLVFVKGSRTAFFDKEPLKLPALYAGRTFGKAKRASNDQMINVGESTKQPDLKCRGTIWRYVNNTKDTSEDARLKRKHPASFPDQLALDHVICWTRPGDLVLDPFVGSGTVAKACMQVGRRVIGFDAVPEYIEIAMARCALVGFDVKAEAA